MSATAKEFQATTVRAAVAALRREDGRRRFLIADEVGLGKTLVARDVVAALSARRRRPLVVFYVTSGSRVGDQNKRDLLAFLLSDELRAALSGADRLGLIPFTKRPEGKVHLYAFAPEDVLPRCALRPPRRAPDAGTCPAPTPPPPRPAGAASTPDARARRSRSVALEPAHPAKRVGLGERPPVGVEGVAARPVRPVGMDEGRRMPVRPVGRASVRLPCAS